METTCVHITGSQSIALMRAARAGDVVRAVPTEQTTIEPLPQSLASVRDLGIDDLLDWLNVHPGNPLTVLTSAADKRTHIPGVQVQSLSVALPPGVFLELRDGTGEHALHLPRNMHVFIDSPALALVQAVRMLDRRMLVAGMNNVSGNKGASASGKGAPAPGGGSSALDEYTLAQLNQLELKKRIRLIAFASECCGSYARDPKNPHAGQVHFDPPGECGRFATPEQLRQVLAELRGVDGVVLAREVSRYAIDESGSPMETYLNLGLTLPPRLAGLSMAQPLANKQLQYKNKRGILMRHKSIRPDLQWPEFHTLAEYLGDKDHESKGARIEDKNRLQDYLARDYTAFFLMFDDVRNVAALNATAERLAREFAKHGKTYEPYRIKRLIKNDKFHDRQITLVSTLLPPVSR